MGTIASTDHELVQASRRGEVDAFGQLVARYQDVVCAVSYSSTGDRALSEDVAQETFVAAWRRLDRVREGSLRPWLCAIARNLGRKARRRTRREQPIEADEQIAAGNPFDDLARADSERIVRDALARLPEKYREVLVLYYRENHSTRDVAMALGIGEDAVMQRLSRGRRCLADGVTELVEKSLRGARPRRDLVAAVLATIAAFAIPTRVDASSLKTKGSTMLKFALAAGVLAAAGTTAYLVHDHQAPTAPVVAAKPLLHYGSGPARRPALGPTAPIHPTVARTATVDDLALLPADAELVVGVDFTRIQNSMIWKLLATPALANAPGLRQLQDECGFDPIASLSSITIGMIGVGEGKDAHGAVVVHGLSKAKVFPCIAKIHDRPNVGGELTMDGDVMLMGTDKQVALAFLDDTTALLVIGPDANKQGIAKIAAQRGGPGAAGYADLIHEINTDDAMWLAVADHSPVLAEINKNIADKTAIQFHGLYGSIDLSDGIVLNAGGRTGSPELVAKLVDEIQKHIEALPHKISDQFEQLDINADDGDVIVSVALSTTQLMQMVKLDGASVTAGIDAE